MTPASLWRHDVARAVARAYARNPRVVAVFLTGSTARGHADRFSDIELGVAWTADPTDEERTAAVRAAGGDLHRLYPQEEGLWEDTFFMGRARPDAPKTGVLLEVVNLRAETVERTLDDVLLRFDTDEARRSLVAALAESVALHGEETAGSWRDRASRYPDGLVRAVVRRYAAIDHFWRWEMYLARGDNLLMLRSHLGAVRQRLVHVLLAVNRVHFLGFKWLDEALGRLAVAPDDFAARLRLVDHLPPGEAATELARLVNEVYDLLETYLPDLEDGEVARFRLFFQYRRPLWEERPPFASGGEDREV